MSKYEGPIAPTQLLDLLAARQSERQYLPTPIAPDAMRRIMEAARLAPSACNAQPWHFVIVDDPERKNQVADAAAGKVIGINHWTKQAPVIIVVVQEKANLTSRIGTLVKGTQCPSYDVAIAVAHLCLQATTEGLGTCIIGWFNRRGIKKLLGIPKQKVVPLLVVLGHPAGAQREKKRKPLADIVSHNAY